MVVLQKVSEVSIRVPVGRRISRRSTDGVPSARHAGGEGSLIAVYLRVILLRGLLLLAFSPARCSSGCTYPCTDRRSLACVTADCASDGADRGTLGRTLCRTALGRR